MGIPQERRDFGQPLRHELNNPLTGILGNAELRRSNIELSQQTVLRLETIATLAVRMRDGSPVERGLGNTVGSRFGITGNSSKLS
jgi:signal transduction histidine kinase